MTPGAERNFRRMGRKLIADQMTCANTPYCFLPERPVTGQCTRCNGTFCDVCAYTGFCEKLENDAPCGGSIVPLVKRPPVHLPGDNPMTRQHFEAIARIIQQLPEATTRQEVARTFAKKLSNWNPRFDEKRFREATK